MDNWIVIIMSKLGLIGVALLMFLENVFPPIPSELIMPMAGFAASQGQMNIGAVITAGTLGSVLGALLLYYLGTKLNQSKLSDLIEGYGKFLLLKPKDVENAQQWFDKYGYSVIFFGRMIPAIRSLISIPAGLNRMPLLPFLALTALGSALWSALLGYAGFMLGSQYAKVAAWIAPISKFVVAGLFIALLMFLVKRFFSEKT